MCDSRNFGSIFNRHTWKYFGPFHRICTKWGRPEKWQEDSGGGSWTWEPRFHKWREAMLQERKWGDEMYPHMEDQALTWLKSIENQGERKDA